MRRLNAFLLKICHGPSPCCFKLGQASGLVRGSFHSGAKTSVKPLVQYREEIVKAHIPGCGLISWRVGAGGSAIHPTAGSPRVYWAPHPAAGQFSLNNNPSLLI